MAAKQTTQPKQATPAKPPVTPPIPEKPNKPLITLMVLALLLLGATGYLAYQNYQLRQQLAQILTSPSPSPTPQQAEDSPTPSPSPTPQLKQIKILSAANWKEVSNNGVSFKIPPEANCNDENACSDVEYTWDYEGHTIPSHIYIKVSDYGGGSRREQFFGDSYEDCHWLYEEAFFGSIKALQIAKDGGWCQGGGGGIVTVIGNKFVVFEDLNYNPETKEINRWDVRDTLISTLKTQ